MGTNEATNNECTGTGYGGWLRFFRIINALYWIIGAIGVIMLPALIYLYWVDDKSEAIDNLALFIEILPGTVLSFIIWKTILVKSENTPNKIKWLMAFELFLHSIVTAGIYYAYKQGYISEGPTPILFSFLYYIIWASYLKRSKRVLSYYGSNTFKTS